MKRMRVLIAFAFLTNAGILLWSPSTARAQIGGMTCLECHAGPTGGGFHGGFRAMSGLTEPEVTAICRSCHDGSYTNPQRVPAPEAQVHEQIIPGSGRAPEYGAFRAGCLDCHTNHTPLLPGDGAKSTLAITGDPDLDETHDVEPTTESFLLNERLVTASTIVIEDDAGTSYLEGVDYQVKTMSLGGRDDPIVIEILPAGAIRADAPVTLHVGYEFGTNQQLLGPEVIEASSTDGIGYIRKPIIDDAGTPGTLDDDFQIGWECNSGIPDDPACIVTDPPADADGVRRATFHIDVKTAGTNWARPSASYDGACNACHTRTGHHRRDDSGGDHSHNVARSCDDCHNHRDGWLNKGG